MVALVTGAARGIGKATAVRLAEEGAKVFVLDRPDDTGGLDEVARSVGGVAVSADITEDGAAATILEAVGDSGLDIVVHNAGVTRDKTLGRMDDARWDLVMAVNLQAIISLEAAFAEAGALNRGGQTIVMSSIAGIAGNMGQSNYAASKAALVGWVAAEAPLRAGQGRGVNAVAPGFIETRLTAAIPVATREGARRLAALSQGGLPVDIAEAVVFLASGAARGITGRTLRVCGGNFIGA
jgi:3-oxoacyl-[acyl-carrier protein] reductase